MSPLKQRIVSMIQQSGPISVAAYMDLCLHDRQHGYYATRPGLGQDFITAPEISQIFGELIGLWLANEWQTLGAPNAVSLIEIGPGRGTLMSDALRASARVPGFSKAAKLHFIEPSPVLRSSLSEQFKAQSPIFLDDLGALSTDQPILLIANEWLDCLPVQQYLRVGEAWHERVIGVSEAQGLVFGLNATPLPPEIDLGKGIESLEIQPGLKTFTETLSKLFERTPGRALMIDYGPANAFPDDTLRSYQNGVQIDPLAAPGESDLTCDVDFARLARLAKAHCLAAHGPLSQSAFLLRLGAEARLNQLANSHPDRVDELYAGIRKLTDPSEMGERFQTICLSSSDLPAPAAF